MVAVLYRLAEENSSEDILCFAYSMERCANKHNTAFVEHFPGKNGIFPAVVKNYCCNIRFCPYCVMRANRRNRATAHKVIKYMDDNKAALVQKHLAKRFPEGARFKQEYRWTLAVLTMPILPGESLHTHQKVFSTALKSFLQSDLWQNTAVGGVRTTERLEGNAEVRSLVLQL